MNPKHFDKLCCAASFKIINICFSIFAMWHYEQDCVVSKYLSISCSPVNIWVQSKMQVIFYHNWLTNFKFCTVVMTLLCSVSFLWHNSFYVLHGVSIIYGVLSILFFSYSFSNICCSYWGRLVIPLLKLIQTLGRNGILCHCCWEIYCNNNMQTVKGHPIPDLWILKTWWIFI